MNGTHTNDESGSRTERLAQLYRAQSLINDAVARATDFKALCEQVCRIGVEEGGIACVLVRLHDAVTDYLIPVAFNGPHTGLIGRAELPAHDSQGVSAIAFQTKQRVIVDDMLVSPITALVASDVTTGLGINSAAAFPLISSGKPIGTFAMFAEGTGFFDAELADLLEQTAAILAFSHEKLLAEAARLQAEERLRLAMSASQSGVWDWDIKTGKSILSDEYYRMFGYEPGESDGNLDFLMRLIPPENRESTLASLEAQWSSGVARTDYEQRFVCKDGSIKWVQIRATIIRAADGTAERMVGTSIDLTERKERERRILQLSRLNAALGKINAAVARVTDFPTLAADACRIAVEDGGFVSAVIRTLDADKAQLTQVADFGVRGGFLGLGTIALAESRGVTTLAFRQGKPVVVRDLKSDPVTQHAAADGERLGINAGAAFPLTVSGVLIGTMTVWAASERFIDEQNLDLLQQMADAVAFAHAKLAADAALAASERDMILAQRAGNIGSMIFDVQSDKWTTSMVGFAVLGLPAADWYPLTVFEGLLTPETHAGSMATMLANIAKGNPTSTDYPFVRASDGARRWLRIVANTEFDSAGKPARRIGTLQDVTAEHQALQRIERANRLYNALSKTNEAIVHAASFAALCRAVCNIVVERGGLVSAAIRLLDDDGKLLVEVAGYGPRAGLGARTNIPVDDKRGVGVAAFHSRKALLIANMADDPRTVESSAAAAEIGITSAAAFPLFAQGEVFGVFSVWASDAAWLDDQMSTLLAEIAAALSFARAKLDADARLVASERDLLMAQRAGRIGSISHDVRSSLWTASEVAADIMGLPSTGPHTMGLFERLLIPAEREQTLARIREAAQAGIPRKLEFGIIRLSDGQSCQVRSSMFTDAGPEGSSPRRVGTIQDITDEHLSAVRIRNLTQLYSALSKTNAAVVHTTDYETLLGEVCRILVEEGKLITALIRLYVPESRSLIEVAAHGPRAGMLGRPAVPINDPHGLSAQAFRDNKPVIVPHLNDHPSAQASRDEARRFGIVAASVFPLRANGATIGTMTLFAGRHDAFDDEFATLIGEIADSVAFARAKITSERAQQEADARMAAIIDSAMDAIITCDEDSRIVVFNDAAQQMFRLPGTEAIGQPLNKLLPERFRAEHPRWMQSFGSQSTGSRAMGRLGPVSALRSDGAEFPVEASISHTELTGRHFYTVIMRDVTAKLANQRALAETERRYRGLVETSLSSIMLLRGKVIQYANPATARMLGFDNAAEVTGMSVDAVTAPEHLDAVQRKITRMMQQPGHTLERALLRLLRQDGKLVETMATGTSINLDGQTLIQLELRDVTRERRALAELKVFAETLEAKVDERTGQLAQANQELAAANRDLESFSYSVAHDLRAPLRAMIGFSQLLEMDLEEGTFDQLPSHTKRISDSAKRMNELIDGLLAVARVTHGALTETEIDCNVLVAEVITSLSVPESVELVVEHLPVMKGDVPSMRQVWVNLISNAVKYSAKQPQPRIEVGITQIAAEKCFHVRDNGAGFEPAYADRLFGVFQRLHTQEQFEGTGVGLAIVRRIIERHGGRVWAEGRPNEGATFYFALPHARLVDA